MKILEFNDDAVSCGQVKVQQGISIYWRSQYCATGIVWSPAKGPCDHDSGRLEKRFQELIRRKRA